MQLLAVEPDNDAGNLRLTWTAFAGSGFEAYEVHRLGIDTDEDIILGEVTDLADTTFADETASAGVTFEYLVAVRASGQTLSSNSILRQLSLSPVEFESFEVNSSTASATLSWSPYSGPRFNAYRVLRRTAILVPEERALIDDVSQVSFVDSGLTGNTEYLYSIEVVTERDEGIASSERSGIIYPLVASWPIDLDSDEVVRLYGDDVGVSALVSQVRSVRLFSYDASGLLTGEVDLDSRNPLTPGVRPRSAAIARSPEDSLFLSVSSSRRHTIHKFDREGTRAVRWEPLFADSLVGLTGPKAVVLGDIVVTIQGGTDETFIFDNLSVIVGETIQVSEDFSGVDPPDFVIGGSLADGQVTCCTTGTGILNKILEFIDEPWGDFTFEVDVSHNSSGAVIIAIGRIVVDEASSATLRLSWGDQSASLGWGFQASPRSDVRGDSESFEQSLTLRNDGSYGVRFGIEDGKILAAIGTYELWEGESSKSTSIAFAASNLIAISSDDRTTAIDRDGQLVSSLAGIETTIAESRSWTPAGSEDGWLGICLPNEHQVLFRPQSSRAVLWPTPPRLRTTPTRVIGGQVGGAAGQLLFPVSFDAASDGRVYVLDAGNSRIQVFDAEANFITEWGTRGGDDGEFDFGTGNAPEDFTGSIAVGGDGFIYVADVGNRRIQKFAP